MVSYTKLHGCKTRKIWRNHQVMPGRNSGQAWKQSVLLESRWVQVWLGQEIWTQPMEKTSSENENYLLWVEEVQAPRWGRGNNLVTNTFLAMSFPLSSTCIKLPTGPCPNNMFSHFSALNLRNLQQILQQRVLSLPSKIGMVRTHQNHHLKRSGWFRTK